jgi:hypothetical protein
LISGARCVLRGEGLWSAEEALAVIEREQASLVYFHPVRLPAGGLGRGPRPCGVGALVQRGGRGLPA